ncbi:MAG TPA: hypothetical protein VKB57_28125, partial [Acidimicrobiales bacterium]|nr:hypothetical protein [Acidimicrobiales bacterium]
MVLCFGTLTLLRARRVRVVWTVHNVVSHDGLHPRLERMAQVLMVRLASALHLPHEAVGTDLRRRLGSAVDRTPTAIIPLPT